MSAIGEPCDDSGRVRLIDGDERPAELHVDTVVLRCRCQRGVQVAAADHLQPRPEPRVIVLAIDGGDDASMGVVELEAATRDADCRNAVVHIELGQDVHAVRGHPEEQPLVDGFAWPLFADDRLDTDPAQEHAQRGPGDSTPDNHGTPDISLQRHFSLLSLASWPA